MDNYTFITGASGGIGKAFCCSCIKKGYNLFITARNEQKLIELKQELLKINDKPNILYFACDLADENSRNDMFKYIQEQKVIFDRLCNVAGVDTQKAFKKYTLEKIAFQCRVNLEATLCVTNFVLNNKAENLEIVTISSLSGVTSMPYFAIYSGTKKALTQIFTALRLEYKNDGVKITTVLPGGVYTREDIKRDIKGQGLWGKLSAKMPNEISEKSLKAVAKNKKILIVGFWNKFIYFIMKLFPENLKMKCIAHRWKNLEKDAF